MSSYEWKGQELSSCSVSQGWVSQLLCICWNSEEIGSSTSEGMNMLIRRGNQAKNEPFFLPLSLCIFLKESVS